MEIGIVAAIAAVIGLAVGYALGSGGNKAPDFPDLRGPIADLLKDLESGSVPESKGPSELRALRKALADWVPEGSEREVAFRLALRRMHTFLDSNIDGPLRKGLDGKSALPAAVKEARAAVRDLEFFLADPSGETKQESLNDLVRRTAKDFTAQWDAQLKLGVPSAPIQVMACADDFMNALYLVLHNAAWFGKGAAVTVEVKDEDSWGRVIIRDEGPGFTAEALSKAYDPFYSTTRTGLGLGLSHARSAIEGQGGRISIRNRPEGGGEVELALPSTS